VAGSVTGVLGRNGAGKTTMLKAIMGLVDVRGGTIRLGAHALTRRATHAIAARGVALVPEERWIFADLTVEQNLRVAAGGRPVPDEVYELFPVLAERHAAKGSELSGGQQQMLALARAIAQQPRVVLLDEPTQGLSPVFVDVVLQYVERLRERGITVVLVEQQLAVVAAVADTVYLMSDGRIRARLQPAELASSGALLDEHLLIGAPPAPAILDPPATGGHVRSERADPTAITYAKVRAVRDETSASHDECRRVLEQSFGEVDAAIALWFAERRGEVAQHAEANG